MALVPLCPHCRASSAPLDDASTCAVHGSMTPCWRTTEASYDDFGEHLRSAGAMATYLPWPMSPGWRISDFAVVTDGSGSPLAVAAACSGVSELDGPVDLVVVTEEPGTGLGACYAGLPVSYPGAEVGVGVPVTKVRVEGHPVPLWLVSLVESAPDVPTDPVDRTVLVGEAFGRWLWLVLRPASALLLLHDEWQLRDLSRLGPALVEVAFGGPAPAW